MIGESDQADGISWSSAHGGSWRRPRDPSGESRHRLAEHHARVRIRDVHDAVPARQDLVHKEKAVERPRVLNNEWLQPGEWRAGPDVPKIPPARPAEAWANHRRHQRKGTKIHEAVAGEIVAFLKDFVWPGTPVRA